MMLSVSEGIKAQSFKLERALFFFPAFILKTFLLFGFIVFNGYAATLADLVPQSISVSPNPAMAGGTVMVNYNVANQGGTNAPASHTRVQIKNASGTVTIADQTFLTAAISANSSVRENRSMSLTGATAGTYKAYVIVDTLSEVIQSITNNDGQFSTGFSFTVQPAAPATPTLNAISPNVITQGASFQNVTFSGSNFTASSWTQFSINGGGTWAWATSAPMFNSPTSMTVGVNNKVVQTIQWRVCASNGSTVCSGSRIVTVQAVVPPPSATAFLGFPLTGYTAYTAPVSSVFDHSMTTLPYCSDTSVIAYTGELGSIPDPNEPTLPSSTTNCPGQQLSSYKKPDGTAFRVNGNYVGTQTTGVNTVNYDGHPGYDYVVPTGTNVLAAANGTAYIIAGSAFNTMYIDHGNGYRTYYLHLSQHNIINGQSVTKGQVIALSGSQGTASAHLYFEVKKNIGGNWVPVDPYGWEGAGQDPYFNATNVKLWILNPPSFGVTIITHGYQPIQTYPRWIDDMAIAIKSRMGVNTPIYTIRIVSNGAGGAQLDPASSSIILDALNSSAIIKVDWSAVAGGYCTRLRPIGGIRSIPTAAIAQIVYTHLTAVNKNPISVPIHLIGHSRGASVMSSLANKLGQQTGVWVDHFTALDAHPLEGGCLPERTDYPTDSWSNVIFSDSYFRYLGGAHPVGMALTGAYMGNLNEIVTGNGAGTAHEQVHTYYHGTIEPQRIQPVDGVTIQPAWYDTNLSPTRAARVLTGYAFSRNALGQDARPDAGLHPGLGGIGARASIPAGIWPNIYLKPPARYTFTAGEVINIPYFYRDGNSTLNITFSLDNDTNPFNTPGASCQKVIGPIHNFQPSTNIVTAPPQSWTTTSADVGTCYIQAKVDDPSGHVRYDYLMKPITINASAAIGANPPTIISPGTSTDTGFTVSSLTPTFTWNQVAGANSYGFYISKQPYGPPNLVYTSTSLTGNSFTIPSGYLVSGTKYRWQMTSIANGVESITASSLLYFQAPTIASFSVTTSASPVAGGVTGGAGTFSSGASVTVVAVPNMGYSFVNWTENGVPVSSAAGYTFTANANRNLVANFAVVVAATYSLNVSAVNGTVVRNPNLANYPAGSQVALTATPSTGYVFSNWSGGATGTSNPLSVTMNSNLSITANFTAAAVQTGSIRVSIVPQAAANAGAQWKLSTENAWRNSGTIASGLLYGGYTVQFKTIPGWTTPPNKTITLSALQVNVWINSGNYVQQQQGIVAAPSNLAAIASSTTFITYTWADNSNNEDYFDLEWRTGTVGAFAHRLFPSPNTTSWLDIAGGNGFAAGQTYCFRIRAHAAGVGFSAYSNVACVTPVVPDTTPPVITLIGSAMVTVSQGQNYVDAGATAVDNVDGNLSGSIIPNNPVNTSVIGSYTVTYNVMDAARNAATQVSRTVNVVSAPDTTPPVITLRGAAMITVMQGSVYNDAGATAVDNRDGNITAAIRPVNSVNTVVTGNYTVTYDVTDAASNPAIQVVRNVYVIAQGGTALPNSAAQVPLTGTAASAEIYSPGQSISNFSATGPTGTPPAGVSVPFGVLSYTTTVPVGAISQTVNLSFSSALPANFELYKVDNAGNYTLIPAGAAVDQWMQPDATTIALTLSDGGRFDLDGVVNGVIIDPVAVGVPPAPPPIAVAPATGGGGGGGCAISSLEIFDPTVLLLVIFSFLLLARRRRRP